MFQWFSKIWNRGRTLPEDPGSRRIVVNRREAGVYVTEDAALRDATVWACVQYLTRAVGQLPWRVFQEAPNGNAALAEGIDAQQLDWLLHHRPNPEMGSFTWRQSMLGMALLWGNAYAEIQWNRRNTAFALWPIHPSRVVPRRDLNGTLFYQVWNNAGGSIDMAAEDIFHLRGFGDGAVGYNVVEYAARTIGWSQATETFGATYFSEGMNPSGIVEMPAGMTPEGLDEMKAAMKALYKGPRGERTMFLDAGAKFTRLATTPNDSQFVETQQHQVEAICRWFGVPPHKVMHLLRATFSNIEHQSIEVVVDCVTPWVKAFEEEANFKLLGENRSGLYTKMNLNGLLRGDSISRMQFYKGLHELGVPINTILQLEDMNGIGPNGDVSFVSNNVQTIDQAIKGKPQPATAAPAASQPEPKMPPTAKGKRKLNGHAVAN